MNDAELQKHERALRAAEIRLWVDERDLEQLTGREPAGARDDLETEIRVLRAAVEEEKQWLAAHGEKPARRRRLKTSASAAAS